MGEAANQGKVGMLAVACAIRNRGNLNGVYGLNHNPKWMYDQPQYVWDRAHAAWLQSATNDITFGATHWENVKAFGVPYWAKDMQKTILIKDHQFYKKK